MFITEWVPGIYPIPFFQTWCCENSSITPSPSPGNWHDLKSAGLPPKMYDCVRDNLLMNRVGVDCIHYLFNDDECRAFIAREYPSDVLDAYDNLIPTAFKADLWRYCVLYMYGGVYLDIKLQFCGGGGGASLRSIVERLTGGGGDGGDGGGGLFVLERDAVGLWSPGRFGIHNAFIITKPKNPILLECIFRIVSASKCGGGGGGCGWGVTGAYDVGWMTRPLFVTGPGLLGDVWRWWHSRQRGGGDDDVPDSYATMAPYFRFFFEGDGRIGYLMDVGRYVQLLKVYDGYHDEYNHIALHRVPHYTVLWSRGVVWRGCPPPNGGILFGESRTMRAKRRNYVL